LLSFFFVLVGVVVWLMREARPNPSRQAMTPHDREPDDLPSEPDEAAKWLEDFAKRQADMGKKRIH
jgi:hypothetical protein